MWTKTCFASNVQISNVELLKNILYKEANQTSLVIFDIDDVLIAPTDEFIFREPIRKKLNKELDSKYTKTEKKLLFSDFFRKRKVILVNPDIIDLLKELGRKGISTTALTRWYTGRFGSIPAMEDLRFKGLDEFSISFVDMSPFRRNIKFPALKTEDGIPMVKNGIILTAFADKGVVLKAALEKEKLKCRKIIFIDDDLVQIQSVEKTCNQLGIEFIGIHYTEATFLPLPKLDESKERLRFEILEKERVWLLDQELEERCKK